MKQKVSQATIDKIKKMGMTAALKSAPKANAEMTEALRRMYGQRRLDAAMGPVKRTANAPSAISNTLKRSAPGAISGKTPVKKSSAPGAISGKKVSTTASKKATPVKRQSDAEKLVGGIKRVINSSPGANIRKSISSSKTTSASALERRKAAQAAVKRAGGRSM